MTFPSAAPSATAVAAELIHKHPKFMHARKLQALVYYAQVYHLQRFGQALFAEKIIAAASGPLVREVSANFAYPQELVNRHFAITLSAQPVPRAGAH